MKRTVTVPGIGRVFAEPDMATVRLGVSVIGESAGSARSSAAKTMQAVLGAIDELGIARRDVRTELVSLNPVLDYQADGGPRVTGYQLSNSVTITLRDLARVGELIDAALGAGASTLDSLEFALADPEPVQKQARSLALDDARARAATLAKGAEATLGQVLSVVEGEPASGPIPYAGRAMALKAEDASTPVEGGTREISVSVIVTFAIG